MIDVILISDARRPNGKKLTMECIHSINQSINGLGGDKKCFPNIIVVESDPDTEWNDYKNITASIAKITTVHPKGAFNYNRFLNEGIAAGKAEYIAMCNNDLVFEKYWAENIISAMHRASVDLKQEVLSASPFCPNTQGSIIGFVKEPYLVGYKIREHISGWCIFVKREIFEKIGKLNEGVNFWFSDNIYADQLQSKKLKHILATRSIVLHVDGGSNTLKTVSGHMQDHLTTGQSDAYKKAKDKVNPDKEKEKKEEPPVEKIREEYKPPIVSGAAPQKEDRRFN